MKTEKLSVRQLLSAIPSYYLDALSEYHHVDLTSKKLLGKDIFHLLLYGLFDSTKLSWRVLEEHYSSPIFQKGFTPKSNSIDHSSLEECLSKIPLTYFRSKSQSSF